MLIGRFEEAFKHQSVTVSEGVKILGVYVVKKTLYIGCSCGKEWKNEESENTWQ
jgi:hypothetical protein